MVFCDHDVETAIESELALRLASVQRLSQDQTHLIDETIMRFGDNKRFKSLVEEEIKYVFSGAFSLDVAEIECTANPSMRRSIAASPRGLRAHANFKQTRNASEFEALASRSGIFITTVLVPITIGSGSDTPFTIMVNS